MEVNIQCNSDCAPFKDAQRQRSGSQFWAFSNENVLLLVMTLHAPSRMAAAPPPVSTTPAPPPEAASESGLVHAVALPAQPSITPDSVLARLPVELEVGVPVRDFRVRNLLALEPGLIIASHWNHAEDLPLAARDVQLAWTQLELVDTTLAARITRLA